VENIDDIQNAPDQRETNRDTRVEAAENQAIGSDLEIDQGGESSAGLIGPADNMRAACEQNS
jgi:hypothetical protein